MEIYISGRQLKLLRVKANISSSVMAEFLGLKSRKTIENWEKGRSSPSINQFLLFCRFCDVHPYEVIQQALFEFEEQRSENQSN